MRFAFIDAWKEAHATFCNKSGELRDVLADFVGVVICCTIGVGLRKLIGGSALNQ